MNQLSSYASLNEMLNWAESSVGADWTNSDDPGPALQSRLQSRFDIALMAEEVDGADAIEPIVSPPFAASFSWSDFDEDVQVAAIRLAIRRTRSVVLGVREKVQAEAAINKDTLLESMQQAHDYSVPLIKGLIEDCANIKTDEGRKLISLLGNAYGTLAWGYGLFDLPRCKDLFDLMITLEAEHPNVSGLCDGLPFALLPLMPDEDSSEGDLTPVQEQIRAFSEVFDRSTGDDDSSWQVNSTGCLAALTKYMSGDEALQIALKASGRLLVWSDSAWIEENAAFAVHHVLESLSHTSVHDQPEIDARMREVLAVYLSKASIELRHKMANSIAYVFTRPGLADAIRNLLQEELCEFLKTVQDAELIESYVPHLAVSGEQIGTEVLGQFWSSVRNAKSPQVLEFWLSALASRPPEVMERSVADEHLRHLRETRADENDFTKSLWTSAFSSVGIALVARDAAQPLRDTITELANDPSRPMDQWLDVAGIAVLGAGREDPDWLHNICSLTESAATEEPINPALRAGLSYFQTAALTENKFISGSDLEAQLDLLERVTKFATRNELE